MHLVQNISYGGASARKAILVAYALAFAVLSMFPYDFLLSYDEWREKLSSENVGWLFVPNCGGKCLLRLIPEILSVAPLAILFFYPARQRHGFLLAAVVGAALGVLIEGLQLTIASGISQGASIGSRALGMMLGVGLMQLAPGTDWGQMRRYVRPILMAGMVPYLGAVAWLNGWFSSSWPDLSTAWLKLEDTHFLPFYYHYFTTETAALISLLFQAALYLPVGAGIWLWRWGGGPERPGPRGPDESSRPEHLYRWPMFAAGALAGIIEAGKLFIPGQHPDPTNILIAAAASSAAYWLLYLLLDTGQTAAERYTQPASVPPAPAVSPVSAAPHMQPMQPMQPVSGVTDDTGQVSIFWRIAGVAALCLAIAAAFSTPLGAHRALPLLVAYVALLWWRPGLWLIYVPALLPLLDLSAWSGRLFWTEFDTALLATAAVGYLRLRPASPVGRTLSTPARLLLSLFALSAAISLGVGLFPFRVIDHNAFSNYTSAYNALRVAKGLAFAIALIPLLALEWTAPAQAARRLTAGMTLGLAGTVMCILWERATFSGLFNFETDYRVTGPFPGMHVGGAYIETFLTAALPFVALFAWQRQRLWTTVLAIGLYGLGAYGVMVTFSRGGQAAFALSTIVVLIGFARLSLRGQARRLYGIAAVAMITGVAAVVAWPVFSGKYSQSRWAETAQDFGSRTAHWADALDIVRARRASFFGLGLGAFPSAYYWNSSASSRTATYAFINEQGNDVLRLGSGDPLYFEQVVAATPEQKYTLSMDLRANGRNAGLSVTLCEKAILYSYTCAAAPLQIRGPAEKWGHYEAQIDTKGFGPPGSRFERPVKLSLYNNLAGTVVDVDNVALRDMQGNNLVHNGDFSRGMDRWSFSTDNYLPWHVENLY
ncbi:MAG: O-antigen ligase family protein, partial [Betaproteobacteria bacterium]|nr:O-antigen ligase family protein [Betaproteobacteria bacterium]